jgi:putative OmpL-like beta-barrel porin-2
MTLLFIMRSGPNSIALLCVLCTSITSTARAQGIRNIPQFTAASDGGSNSSYAPVFLHPASDCRNAGFPACREEMQEPSTPKESQPVPSKPQWHYGGFFDLGYLLDFNHPANEVFRSRGTTWHVDDAHFNMAAAYVKKDVNEQSRWGAQLTVQAGKDSQEFGFSATAPKLPGYRGLRHLGPANVSYLARAGRGLTLQGGIFASLIGYDSLYAKDNFEYTRPWGADFTPYLMMGGNASYPFNRKLTGALFLINGYWHLADANSVPSSGGQLAYTVSPVMSVKETVLWGPHQSDTSFRYWRYLTDTIVERKTDRLTTAFEYIYSAENVATTGNPYALMMSSQLPVHWTMNKQWSVTIRPEVFWDRDGRWTLARQTVKAVTTTLEYRISYRKTNTILRLEHRYDDSRGPDGGFFRGAEIQPGVVGLTPTQNLLIFGLIFTLDH